MFKRVDRRLKRKAEQEELGIDSELKEALGIPDTDSDESDSSDDDEESDEDEGEDEGNVEEDEADVEEDIDVDDDEEEEEALSDDGSEDDEYDRSVADVLANPLYPSATDPDKTRCSVCPGKTLSSPLKIGEHLKSKHHTRRFTQFSQNIKTCEDQEEIATKYLPRKQVEDTAPVEGTSKREQKKLARRAFQAKKREEKKAAFLARKDKRTTTPASSEKARPLSPKPKPQRKQEDGNPKAKKRVKEVTLKTKDTKIRTKERKPKPQTAKHEALAPPKKKRKTVKVKS